MSKIENPPAFPVPEVRDHDGCGVREGSDGMTLRDYFAGQALAGLSAHLVGTRPKRGETAAQAEARWAYERADAMLAARQLGRSDK